MHFRNTNKSLLSKQAWTYITLREFYLVEIDDEINAMGDHPFSACAKFFEKLKFFTPWYALLVLGVRKC